MFEYNFYILRMCFGYKYINRGGWLVNNLKNKISFEISKFLFIHNKENKNTEEIKINYIYLQIYNEIKHLDLGC